MVLVLRNRHMFRCLFVAAIGALLLTAAGCVPAVHVIWAILPLPSSVAFSSSDMELVRQVVTSLDYRRFEERTPNPSASESYWLAPSGNIIVRITPDDANGQIR